MNKLRPSQHQIRPSELAAIEAPLTDEPFLPDNLDIVVAFGSHDQPEDFDFMKPLLNGADVFIPETPNWTPEEIALCSRIAQGDTPALYELDELVGGLNNYTWAKLEALLNSGIRLTPIDYAKADARSEEISNHYETGSGNAVLGSSLDQSLANVLAFAAEEADISDYREDTMLRSIGPRLEALIAADSDLQAKDRIRVLIQLGAYHTYFHHKLSKIAAKSPTVELKRKFDPDNPPQFSPIDRITRADRAGKILTKDQRLELALKAVGILCLGQTSLEEIVNNLPPGFMQVLHARAAAEVADEELQRGIATELNISAGQNWGEL